MHKDSGPPQKGPRLVRVGDALRLLTFGWYFATCIVLGVVGGLALDRWLDTGPWFLLGGLLLGPAVGFYGMFQMLRPLYRRRGKGDGKRGEPE